MFKGTKERAFSQDDFLPRQLFGQDAGSKHRRSFNGERFRRRSGRCAASDTALRALTHKCGVSQAAGCIPRPRPLCHPRIPPRAPPHASAFATLSILQTHRFIPPTPRFIMLFQLSQSQQFNASSSVALGTSCCTWGQVGTSCKMGREATGAQKPQQKLAQPPPVAAQPL